LPIEFSDKVEMDLRKKSDLAVPHSTLKAVPKATAIAVEAEIPALADLTLIVDEGGGPRKVALSESEKDVCKAWTSLDDPCVVIELENWTSMEESEDCKKDPSLPGCRLDEHFGAFYNFLEADSRPAQAERWLPYVAKYETLTCAGAVVGPGHFPAKRCPMAISQ
jgi:hypothetical protein